MNNYRNTCEPSRARGIRFYTSYWRSSRALDCSMSWKRPTTGPEEPWSSVLVLECCRSATVRPALWPRIYNTGVTTTLQTRSPVNCIHICHIRVIIWVKNNNIEVRSETHDDDKHFGGLQFGALEQILHLNTLWLFAWNIPSPNFHPYEDVTRSDDKQRNQITQTEVGDNEISLLWVLVWPVLVAEHHIWNWRVYRLCVEV